MSQDASRLPVDACLHRLGELERAKARLEARQIQYLARLWDNPPPVPDAGKKRHLERLELARMSITAEVGCALRIPHEPPQRGCSRPRSW
jgi:hypothetical protein